MFKLPFIKYLKRLIPKSGYGIFKKLVFVTLIFSIFASQLALPKFIHAQTQTSPWYIQTPDDFFNKVYNTQMSPPDEIFGERYTAAQVRWVLFSLFSNLIAIDGNSARIACIINSDVTSCLSEHPLFSLNLPSVYQPNLPVLTRIFQSNRDLSAVSYVRGTMSKLHIIPEVQAQTGFGFGALTPVRTVWRIFRDVTYGLFVLIIIALAFMIMLRYKLDPQTVVTIQSAIPRIVISLILVTFSYAIAGFMIDLVYVVIGLVALIFSSTGIFQGADWSRMFTLLTDGPLSAGYIGWLVAFIPLLFMGIVGSVYSATGLEAISVGGVIVGFFLAIIGFIFILAFIMWAFITIFKILARIVRSYVTILLLVIFAPLIIAVGTLAPRIGFGWWIRSLAANLAVFPVIGALFLIAVMFLGPSYQGFPFTISQVLGIPNIQDIFCTGPGCAAWYPPLTFGVQSGSFDPLPILWLISTMAILAFIPMSIDLVRALAGRTPDMPLREMFTPGISYLGGRAARQVEEAEAGRRNIAVPKAPEIRRRRFAEWAQRTSRQ